MRLINPSNKIMPFISRSICVTGKLKETKIPIEWAYVSEMYPTGGIQMLARIVSIHGG
jgi:hypothetical protein